jgi:hypothetical protein
MLIPSDHSWLPIEISSHGGFPLRHTDKHASNQHELNPSQIQDGCSRIATQITASYHDLTSSGSFGRTGSWYKSACLFMMEVTEN